MDRESGEFKIHNQDILKARKAAEATSKLINDLFFFGGGYEWLVEKRI